MAIKDRLLTFIESKKISKREFARIVGLSNGYIDKITDNISQAKVENILNKFPELSRVWLLTGEGEMLNGTDKTEGSTEREYKNGPDHYGRIPLIPIEVMAGSLNGFADEGVRGEDCPMVPSPVPGARFAIQISGDSMSPTYPNGTRLFIQKINQNAFIPWGHPVVLDTENGAVFKRIYRDKTDPDYVIGRSINPDYPDLEIYAPSIYGIYKVLGHMCINTTF